MNDELINLSDIWVEVFFEYNSFKEILEKYPFEIYGEWYIIHSYPKMLAKEFNSYFLLIYPYEKICEDFLKIFSNKFEILDKFKEFTFLPNNWKTSITFKINKDFIALGSEFNITIFHGIDLINNILKDKNMEFKILDDCEVELRIKLTKKIDGNELIKIFELLYYGLKIYYDIKKEQETIVMKLISRIDETLDKINSF
jgi:hypothetical protein